VLANEQAMDQQTWSTGSTNGQIAPGSVRDHAHRLGRQVERPQAFINQDAKGNLHFPGFAKATTMCW